MIAIGNGPASPSSVTAPDRHDDDLAAFDEEHLRSVLIQTAGRKLTLVADSSSASIEDQLRTIRQCSASFEDILSRTRQVQTGIHEISGEVDNVVDQAARSSDELGDVTRKMKALEERFDSIGGLVQTVNQIADRTNLLSLNAAIEAARAGEAGRGFAVVAGEVKELAATTKTANREIGQSLTMIGEAIADVSQSVLHCVHEMQEAVTAVAATREKTSAIGTEMGCFSTQVQTSCDSFRSLNDSARQVENETSEVRTIGRTFSRLIELMARQQCTGAPLDPIARLSPLVESSDFEAPERFSRREPEYVLQEDDVLISATDTRGKITFANNSFCEIAEYAAADLTGVPHNIIRHPDMPRTAFADMWSVIRGGQLWQGYIANRSASGRLYWVKAHVFPCFEDGEVSGYISIRTRPDRSDIERCIQTYRTLP